jgi:hypothetical protein
MGKTSTVHNLGKVTWKVAALKTEVTGNFAMNPIVMM